MKACCHEDVELRVALVGAMPQDECVPGFVGNWYDKLVE